MNWLRPLFIALQLLTRLPVPGCGYDAQSAGRSLLFYPAVGALLGGLLAAAGWLLSPYVPGLPLAALLLGAWVMLTGALHLDGLADSADGWLGGHGSREKTLAIMHDPRSGPAAIVAVILVLLMKFSALATVVASQAWLGLAAIPMLARTIALLLFLTTRCACPDGMAANLASHLPRGTAWFALSLGLGAALAFPGGPSMLLATLLSFVLLRRLMLARIGGMTGDTTGALIEISEATALLLLGCSRG